MTKDISTLVIATKNPGKIKEMTELLAHLPLVLRGLDEFPAVEEPPETGATFTENAVLKARYYALQTGARSLADDSGLEVAALGGAPGVLSARYAGAAATDQERIGKLLGELNAAPESHRHARFVCAMAIAAANGEIERIAEGFCAGEIARTARGTNGFGYDPIFIPDGFTETFGELAGGIKSRLSHRARAINNIIEYLHEFELEPD